MAQQNRGRTTAVKEEEEQKGSGILPYVVGGLVGVAAGLLGSVLIDKTVAHLEAREAAQSLRSGGSCEANSCAVCLDEAVPTFQTRCCGQQIHRKCVEELRSNAVSRCPFCRSRAWLG